MPLRVIFLIVYVVFIIKELLHLLEGLLYPSLNDLAALSGPELDQLVGAVREDVALVLEHVVFSDPRQAFLTPYQQHMAYLGWRCIWRQCGRFYKQQTRCSRLCLGLNIKFAVNQAFLPTISGAFSQQQEWKSWF